MEKADLIAAIAAKHGIRLDADDPAFLIVDLNRLVLEDKANELVRLLEEVTAKAHNMQQISDSVQKNLSQTLESVEATAMAMGKFAQQEREAQAISLKAATDYFAEENRKSTQSFKAHLWVVIALLSVLLILQAVALVR